MRSASDVAREWRPAWAAIRARSATLSTSSMLQELAELPDSDREAILATITVPEWRSLMDSPEFWLRPKQMPPAEAWRFFCIFAGRGFGKNAAAACWIKHRVEREGAMSIGFVGPTMTDVVTNMLEDPDAGIFNIFDPSRRPQWLSKKDGVFEFYTGAIGYCYSAEVPEIRGPNIDTLWVNEIVKMYGPSIPIMWDNVLRTLRKRTSTGHPSRGIVTTSPDPAIPLLCELCTRPNTYVVTGETDENTMGLDPAALADLDNMIASASTIARERRGDMVADEEGALWTSEDIEKTRVVRAPVLLRSMVAVDPAVSTKKTSDDTGIIGGGLGEDGDCYILVDRSGRLAPEQWASNTLDLHGVLHADALLVEDNRIGDNAASNLRAAMRERKGQNAADSLPIIEKHAWESKGFRAEPVATLWKLGRVHIVGHLPELEREMTTWNPATQSVSPNRVDAMVHLVTVLMGIDRDTPRPKNNPFTGIANLSQALGSGSIYGKL